jgi:hypothetical protein
VELGMPLQLLPVRSDMAPTHADLLGGLSEASSLRGRSSAGRGKLMPCGR